MTRSVRFGTFVREVALNQKRVPFNALVEADEGAATRARLQLGSSEIYKLIEPYVSARFVEQARAVLPLAAYLVLFQLLILRQDLDDAYGPSQPVSSASSLA